jgi:hypothetical protein
MVEHGLNGHDGIIALKGGRSGRVRRLADRGLGATASPGGKGKIPGLGTASGVSPLWKRQDWHVGTAKRADSRRDRPFSLGSRGLCCVD